MKKEKNQNLLEIKKLERKYTRMNIKIVITMFAFMAIGVGICFEVPFLLARLAVLAGSLGTTILYAIKKVPIAEAVDTTRVQLTIKEKAKKLSIEEKKLAKNISKNEELMKIITKKKTFLSKKPKYSKRQKCNYSTIPTNSFDLPHLKRLQHYR